MHIGTFKKVMKRVGMTFDPMNFMTEERMEIYWEGMKHIPDDDFERIGNTLWKEYTGTGFPVPAYFFNAWRSFHQPNQSGNILDEAERAAPPEAKQFFRDIKDTLKSAGALPASEEQKPETNADDILASTYLTGGQS